MTAELIARLESADGPSGSLLLEAAKAVWVWDCVPTGVNPDAWVKRWNRFHRMLDAEAWTNAAEMLVPDGHSFRVGQFDDGSGYAEIAANDVHMMNEDPDEFYWECEAASTPALALAAAALKARGV